MAESDSGDRTLDASPHKLQQARQRGEVAISREGSSLGVMLAALIGILLGGGMIASRISAIMLPMLDQPDAYMNLTPQGVQAILGAVGQALALAVLPLFGLLLAGAFLPYVLQGSITVTMERLTFKPSHFNPMSGLRRLFNPQGLFQFAKGLLKMVAVGAACFVFARPLYENSIGLVATNLAVLPQMMQSVVVKLLLAATLVSGLVACIDIPYQHWIFRRGMRMTLQEMKDELRATEGDPHVKARLRRIRRQRAQRRMMHDVPKAAVVITNPTHFAVALRYRRGEDAAPVVVAKGVDLIALRIRRVAHEHNVAVMENPPLARALHASVEIGQTIPHEHFEAVAKIIGLVWARRSGTAQPQGTAQ